MYLDHAHVAHMCDIYLDHVIHMNDTHMHVTHMNTSRHNSHVWIFVECTLFYSVTCAVMNSCRTYDWVTSHAWMRHVTHTNKSLFWHKLSTGGPSAIFATESVPIFDRGGSETSYSYSDGIIHLSTKEPYISLKEPYASRKNVYISTKEPCVFSLPSRWYNTEYITLQKSPISQL